MKSPSATRLIACAGTRYGCSNPPLTPPTPVDVPSDSNVEMSWQVFGGEWQEIYLALLKQRCLQEGAELTNESLGKQFRLHLHRGIGYLAAPQTIRSIDDLVRLTVEERDA